jgi:hypothetical protein
MIAQRFQEEFQKDLKSNLLPTGYTTSEWFDAAMYALGQASPAQLGISVSDYETLHLKLSGCSIAPLSMFEFAVANNMLEGSSRKALDLNFPSYITLQKEVYNLAKDWTARTEVIRTAVQKRINEEEKAKAALNGERAKPEPGFMKPVIGEA